jgi:hypothetical protein
MELKLIDEHEIDLLAEDGGIMNISVWLEMQVKSDLRQIYEWGNQICTSNHREYAYQTDNTPVYGEWLGKVKRRYCDKCWQELSK